MEKVRQWCGQTSDPGRLKNRTEQFVALYIAPGRACKVLPSACLHFSLSVCLPVSAFSALTLLVWRQERHPACKKLEWWGAGVVICLEQGADLHMAQLMPLPLTVSCFSKIQIGSPILQGW